MLKVKNHVELKEVEKIQKKLRKDIEKDTKKLTKICGKFIKTQDLCLVLDFEYYGNKIYNDSQQLFLIESMFEESE